MAVAASLAFAVAAVRVPQILLVRFVRMEHLRWVAWWVEYSFTVPRFAGLAVAASWRERWRWAAAGNRAATGWTDSAWASVWPDWGGALDLTATWYQSLPF